MLHSHNIGEPMMITCRQACDQAIDFDANTAGNVRLALRFHLLMCKHCRRFARQMRLTLGVARLTPHTASPSDDEIDSMIQLLATTRTD